LLLITDSIKLSSKYIHFRVLQTVLVPILYQANLTRQIVLPSTIIVGISNISIKSLGWNLGPVISYFTQALLIFLSLEQHLVGIGCYACKEINSVWRYQFEGNNAYSVTFKMVPEKSARSYESLIKFWKQIHSNFHLAVQDEKNPDCLCFFSYSENININKVIDGTCKIFEDYFRYVNCTNYSYCHGLNILDVESMSLRSFSYLRNYLPFGSEKGELHTELFFPKEDFFDANFAAFLKPFSLTVWIFFAIMVFDVSSWMVFVEHKTISQEIHQQVSILLEHCVHHIDKISRRGIFILFLWIFSTNLLRQYYNSSLYSLITAEVEQTGFPQDMEQVINTPDFDLLTCSKLTHTFGKHVISNLNLSLVLERVYVKILKSRPL